MCSLSYCLVMLGKKVSEENLQSILDLEQRALGRISPEKLEHLGLAAWGLDGFSLRLMGQKLSVNPPPPPPFWWLKSLILGEAWGDSKCYVNVNYADVYIYIHFLQNKFDVFHVLCGCTGAIAC